MKPDNERWTIAVDFDGVLHSYTSPWVNEHTIPDPPVEGAIEWLGDMAKKFDVVIFTTRGRTFLGRCAVKQWLWENGVSAPEAECASDLPFKVTHEKPPALVYLDDRAMRFEGTFPSAAEVHAARPWNKRKEAR